MIKAIIDIGTNSVRLLAAECSGRQITPLITEVQITRLGQGVDKSGLIAPEALARTAQVVAELAAKARKTGAESLLMTATSAVRDARNKAEVAKTLQAASGVSLRVLSGPEEARMSYDGAVLDFAQEGQTLAVLDIGGGSTELVYPTADGLNCASVNIGAVRLAENPDISCAQRLQGLIGADLPQALRLLAVGGTATSLAAMEQQLAVYDSAKVHGFALSYANVCRWRDALFALTLSQRQQIVGLMPKRADIIPYGAAILAEAMTLLDLSEVTVSDKDLLYGLLLP